MADEKLVLKGGYLEFPAGGSDKINYARQVLVSPSKSDVDVSALGDLADRHGKGPAANSMQIEWINALDASLQKLILQELEKDTPTSVVVRFKTGAKALDNPELTFDVSVQAFPSGGTRGEASTSSVTWPIDGRVTWDDGVTTIVI